MEALRKRQASRATSRKRIVKDIRGVQLKQMEAQVRSVRDEIALKETIRTENDKLNNLEETFLEKRAVIKQKKAQLESLKRPQAEGKVDSVHLQFQNRVLVTKMKLQIRAIEDEVSKLARVLANKNKLVSNLCSNLEALQNQPAIKSISLDTTRTCSDDPAKIPAVFYPKQPVPDCKAKGSIETQRQVNANQIGGELLAAHSNLRRVQSVERVSIRDVAAGTVKGNEGGSQGKTECCSKPTRRNGKCNNNQSAKSHCEQISYKCSQREGIAGASQRKQVHPGIFCGDDNEKEVPTHSFKPESITTNIHFAQTWHTDPLRSSFGDNQFSMQSSYQGMPWWGQGPPAVRHTTTPAQGFSRDNFPSRQPIQAGYCGSYANAATVPGFNVKDVNRCPQNRRTSSISYGGIAGYSNEDQMRMGSYTIAGLGRGANRQLAGHLVTLPHSHRVLKSEMEIEDLD